MRPLLKVAAVVLVLSITSPAVSHAETFVIREGSIGFDTGDPPLFGFRSEGLDLRGLFPAIATSGAFTCGVITCVPGASLDLGTVFGGPLRDFSLGQGFATINGVQHGTDTGPPGQGHLFLTGTLTFETPDVVIPPGGADPLNLTAPFLFSGRVVGANESPVMAPLFELDLSGVGVARMSLDLDNGVYQFQGVEYVFAASEPIPEPAALILVGSGLAGLVARRRRLRTH